MNHEELCTARQYDLDDLCICRYIREALDIGHEHGYSEGYDDGYSEGYRNGTKDWNE